MMMIYGMSGNVKVGPGPVEVTLDIQAPRELRRITNVLAWLDGDGPGLVLAGNHRDAWVRGAHDAGGGTVALGLYLLLGVAACAWGTLRSACPEDTLVDDRQATSCQMLTATDSPPPVHSPCEIAHPAPPARRG